MQTSLSRACASCIRAKKRCDRELPQCSRCADRGLCCTYRNEPLPTPPGQVEPKSPSVTSLTRSRCASHGEVPRVQGSWACQNGQTHRIDRPRITSIADPILFLPMDFESVTDIVQRLNMYPLDFIQKGGSDFIHPLCYRQRHPEPLKLIHQICRIKTSQLHQKQSEETAFELSSSVCALMASAETHVNFLDILAFVQSLCLLQIMVLFSPVSTREELVEAAARMQTLRDWTTTLWNNAPSCLPSTLSSQEAYILAEAVRRTIMVSSKIQGCYRVLKTGFFKLTLYVESLPFGETAELWDADIRHEQADYTKAKLLSYREYCDLWDAGMIRSATPFERMLLVACKGKAAVDATLAP